MILGGIVTADSPRGEKQTYIGGHMLNSYNSKNTDDDTKQAKFDKNDILMSRKEAATYIGFKAGTLAVWDCTKRYDLKPVRYGRTVRYLKSVLDAFLLAGMQP